jgi:hypothetical protein
MEDKKNRQGEGGGDKRVEKVATDLSYFHASNREDVRGVGLSNIPCHSSRTLR